MPIFFLNSFPLSDRRDVGLYVSDENVLSGWSSHSWSSLCPAGCIPEFSRRNSGRATRSDQCELSQSRPRLPPRSPAKSPIASERQRQSRRAFTDTMPFRKGNTFGGRRSTRTSNVVRKFAPFLPKNRKAQSAEYASQGHRHRNLLPMFRTRR